MDELTHGTGDLRNEIYAYRDGKQKPGAPRVRIVGDALRDAGVAWCSGPIALFAAGYLGEFVHTIANLAVHDTSLAVWLAALAPIAFRDGPHNVASRLLLEVYPSVDDRGALVHAFERKTTQGAPDVLVAIEQLARSKAALEVLEPAVIGALRSWAHDAADTELRDLLLRDLIEFEINRLRTQLGPSIAVSDLTRRILAASDLRPPPSRKPRAKRRVTDALTRNKDAS